MAEGICRSVVSTSILAALLACGCATRRPARTDAVARAWERPAANKQEQNPAGNGEVATAPETAALLSLTQDSANRAPDHTPEPPRIIARVNGDPILRDRLTDVLIDAFGLDTLELLIRVELARNRATGQGLSVTAEDVRAEYDRALREVSSPVLLAEESAFDRESAERVLGAMLHRNRVSQTQFMIRMEQNAWLRKLAEREAEVKDDMLAAEHKRAYGERVRIRHAQLDSLAEVSEVRERLAAGEDFELLVRKYSRNEVTAAAGGLLPAFSRYDDVPPLLRDAAFALNEGQVSNPIYEGGAYHMIRLERRFPASAVSAELVKDELRERVHRRMVGERMRQLAAELFDNATIEITDSGMLHRFREKYPTSRTRSGGP